MEEISGRHLFRRGLRGAASSPVFTPYFRDEEDNMDVTRLTTTATTATTAANESSEISRVQARKPVKTQVKKETKEAAPKIDKTQLKLELDRMIRDTRFQYVIKDELDYFVVRIIDKNTDKVIREIPSKELQRVHENINQALGLLFDELR